MSSQLNSSLIDGNDAIEWDVAICGAGPAGLSAGTILAQNGFKVVIFDAREHISRKVCGEYLCPTGVALLEELGVAEECDKKFLPVIGMRLVSATGLEVMTHFPAIPGRPHHGLSTNRKDFDSLLSKRAQDVGVEIKWGHRLNSIRTVDHGHWFQTSHGEFFCKLLIGADGRNSFVAKNFLLTQKSSRRRVSFHVFLPRKVDHGRVGEMHLFADGAYAGLDPITPTEMNFSICCDVEVMKKLGGPREAMNYYIQQSTFLLQEYGEINQDDEIHSVYPITHQVEKSYSYRVALIGDAGGFIDPLTGEGMYVAMWTGIHLAQEIKSNVLLDDTLKTNSALERYHLKKIKFFAQKRKLSLGFQWLIARPWPCEMIGRFLRADAERGHIFVGIIGNVYRPLDGFWQLAKTLLPHWARRNHALYP